MSKPHDSLASSAYASFALQQPLMLEQLAVAADDLSFPLASTQTPEWFSAAGSPGSSLADTAPELVVGRGAGSADGSQEKLDLVRMYAPELGPDDAKPPTPPRPPINPAPEAAPAAEQPDEAMQMLRELDNLDT